MAFTSIEESSHGVAGAQGAQRRQVDNLRHGVRIRQMEYLRVQEIVAVEQQFRKQPVVLAVLGVLGQSAADVGLDGERQEVVGRWMLVEVGVTGCGEATRLEPVVGLVGVACEE